MSRAAAFALASSCVLLACGGSNGAKVPACAAGQHDGGNGVCVAVGSCSLGFHDGGDGTCTSADVCAAGYRLGTDGTCVKGAACPAGTHDNGAGVCVATISCPTGYHDGGSGTCVPTGSCSSGYRDGGNGECWILGTCASGYHDGGTGTCVPLVACSAKYHDGGDGRCVPDATCSNGFHDGGDGRCVTPDKCSAGYHDGGGATCTSSSGCLGGYRDNGVGACVCRPSVSAGTTQADCPCANGFHDDGLGKCVVTGCASGYRDGGDGRCVAIGGCSAGFYDDGSGVCIQRADAGIMGTGGGAGGSGGARDTAASGGASGAGGSTVGRDGGPGGASGARGSGGIQATGGVSGTGGTTAPCGNGKLDPGESCDCGSDPKNLPSGCSSSNGIFYGDGTGCTRTCTREPLCLDGAGKTQACSEACGDGHLSDGEACDDGNQLDGDGCSHDCTVEDGFVCSTATLQDSQPCQSSGSGECMELPIVYRDFQPENATLGGHPDFYFLGSKWNGSPTPTTICVPNAAGPARGSDSTARCWGIVADTLLNGKPQLGTTTTCACQFSDWNIAASSRISGGYTQKGNDSPLSDGNGGYLGETKGAPVNATNASGTSIGVLIDYTQSTPGGPVWKGTVPIVKDASSFKQWYSDDSTVNTTFTDVLELKSTGYGSFQFASQAHLGEGGFFPLDTRNSSHVTLCNLWPYWNHGNGSSIWGYGCTGDQYLFYPQATASDCVSGDTIDDGCWVLNVAGRTHNYYFTSEARYHFVYDGSSGVTLSVYADDDFFVFINGQLVLDLGGIHMQLPGKVTVTGSPGDAKVVEGGCLDTAGNIIGITTGSKDCAPKNGTAPTATTPDDFRVRTVKLGLETGKTYELAIFHANRSPPQSDLQITLQGLSVRRSICTPSKP